MSKFVVATFSSQAKTNRVALALREMHAQSGAGLYSSAIVSKDRKGKLAVRNISDEGLGGSVVGALIGALAGLPGGPLAATVGAAGGALIGLSADLINQGTDDAFAETILSELPPGKAAIVAEVTDDAMSSLQALVDANGGTLSCR